MTFKTSSIFFLVALLKSVHSCPDHGAGYPLYRRADSASVAWSYDASYDWGKLTDAYATCKTGIQQSPISITLNGVTNIHTPHFASNYANNVTGQLLNWGYGPAMNLDVVGTNWTSLPSFTFEEDGKNETVYLKGWHIHTPGEHIVDSKRAKAEMHFVHVNAEGHERAVVGIRIDPGQSGSESKFFSSLPSPLISFKNTTTRVSTSFNPNVAIKEVGTFKEYFTYKGSLTSPPCTEGIRWFLAKDTLLTSTQQMQDILATSAYSARVEQGEWLHEVNV